MAQNWKLLASDLVKSLDSDLLVKEHWNHRLEHSVHISHTARDIIQPGCNKYLDSCGQEDGPFLCHTVMVKQHFSQWSEATWPSKFREKSRQVQSLLSALILCMSKRREKLPFIFPVLFNATDAWRLLGGEFTHFPETLWYFSDGNNYNSRESSSAEHFQELREIWATVRESMGPGKSQIPVSSMKFQGAGM